MNITNLKIAIIKKDLNGVKIAEVMGVTEATVSRWVNGKGIPNFEQLIKLADLLGVSLDYLAGRE